MTSYAAFTNTTDDVAEAIEHALNVEFAREDVTVERGHTTTGSELLTLTVGGEQPRKFHITLTKARSR